VPYIQSDAAVNPGNRGVPLIPMRRPGDRCQTPHSAKRPAPASVSPPGEFWLARRRPDSSRQDGSHTPNHRCAPAGRSPPQLARENQTPPPPSAALPENQCAFGFVEGLEGEPWPEKADLSLATLIETSWTARGPRSAKPPPSFTAFAVGQGARSARDLLVCGVAPR